jgi:hypothetical protein
MSRSRKKTAEILIQNVSVYGCPKLSLFIRYLSGSFQKFNAPKAILRKCLFTLEALVFFLKTHHKLIDPTS